MSSICISSNVLVNALNSNLKSCTPVGQQIWKMSFSTKIRPCFNSYSNTFRLALLWKLDSLFMIWRNVPTERIMQISNKEVPIFLIQRHESSTHNYKFNLINVMSNLLQLLDSISSLDIGVVSGSNSSHWCRFVSCIGLSRIFKIWVRASRAIDAYITCSGYMRASMRFAHYSNYGNSTGCTNGLSF